MDGPKRKRYANTIVLIFNLLIAALLALGIINYIFRYQTKLYNQNVNDIVNINQATANIASEFFSSQEKRLRDIMRYLERHELDLQELLIYLDDVNSDSETSLQLIGKDFKGYAISKGADGTFAEIDYTHTDYSEIQKVFTAASDGSKGINFSSEFTDQLSGERSFAKYIYITATDSSVKSFYTLMVVSKSAQFLDLINIGDGYDALSSVLINKNGNYILRNSDFKSINFFQYIYIYNNLSLDEMNALRDNFTAEKHTEYRYLNSENEDCLFVNTEIPDTQWLSVSCVPVASFHTKDYDIRFTVFIIATLTAMMGIDLLWLATLNKRLKTSMLGAQTANEAKTDFLSRMSHDIRTPINVITGMTELALQEKNPPSTEAYLANIQSSGKFLLGLVNDILDMNKVESGMMELHPKPYSFFEFRSYINAVISPLCAAKSIEFTMSCSTDSIIPIVDSLRLNQIFFNLLSNSVKFTHSKGHISLTANAEEIADKRVALDFIVEDDGIGMSEEFQQRMFNAFTQEEKSGTQSANGTGLGLAIVKSLIELMDGSISVKSELGKGTTFYIHLETDTSEISEAVKKAGNETIYLSGKRILLFEDHPLNTQIIVKLLEKKGAIVDSAENGQIGVEMFSASSENYYNAVLMDIRMPVMNGLEATKMIRKMKDERSDAGSIPIIALTANAYDADVQNCIDAGMNAHLAKPIEPPLLYSTLCGFMAGDVSGNIVTQGKKNI